MDPANWFFTACPSSGPDTYIMGDSVRYVWMSGDDSGTKAFMRSAHSGTLATGFVVNVHPGQGEALKQNVPRIAGRGDTLGIVWQRLANVPHGILFAYSTTGLSDIITPETVNVAFAAAHRTWTSPVRMACSISSGANRSWDTCGIAVRKRLTTPGWKKRDRLK